jgi:peptidoglycan glycosyltransferase
MQPSEPLKLLLVIYLSAYLADQQFSLLALKRDHSDFAGRKSAFLFPMLVPTLLMTGMAILLLFVQRDLGTASVFIFLYASIIYLASGFNRILWVSLALLLISSVAGYFLFDVVKLRMPS